MEHFCFRGKNPTGILGGNADTISWGNEQRDTTGTPGKKNLWNH